MAKRFMAVAILFCLLSTNARAAPRGPTEGSVDWFANQSFKASAVKSDGNLCAHSYIKSCVINTNGGKNKALKGHTTMVESATVAASYPAAIANLEAAAKKGYRIYESRFIMPAAAPTGQKPITGRNT